MTPQDPEHRAVWELLPWVANGRASAAQRARVDAHLPHCPACAASLAHEQELHQQLQRELEHAPLPALEPGLARLMQRIDAAEALPSRPRMPGLAWVGRLSPGLLLGTVGLQALALLVLGAALWRAPTGVGAYQTHGAQAPAQGPVQLRLRLAPELSLAGAQALLQAQTLELRGQQGADWLVGRADARLIDEQALERLRGTPGVLLAERVLP